MISSAFYRMAITRGFRNKTLFASFAFLSFFVINVLPLALIFPGAAYAETPPQVVNTDVSIIIYEYDMETSGSIFPGKYNLLVRNVGSMYHEVVVFKLNPGVTSEQFKEVVGHGGSLAKLGRTKGNMPPIEYGTTGNLAITFEPGHYLLLCFRVDKASGKPHFMIGMLREVTVE